MPQTSEGLRLRGRLSISRRMDFPVFREEERIMLVRIENYLRETISETSMRDGRAGTSWVLRVRTHMGLFTLTGWSFGACTVRGRDSFNGTLSTTHVTILPKAQLREKCALIARRLSLSPFSEYISLLGHALIHRKSVRHWSKLLH